MVIDALLLCFCEDCQMNDGVTEGKEYYMDPSLMVCTYCSLVILVPWVYALLQNGC